MKLAFFALGLILCLTPPLTSAQYNQTNQTNQTDQTNQTNLTLYADSPFPIPAEMDGYTGYSLEQAKNISSLLNPFVSYSITCVANAIMSKQFAPENYSFFMRYAFRMIVEGGFDTLYYYRAYNPTNETGKIYYGTFTVLYPTWAGYQAKFLNYTVDVAADRLGL